MLHGLFGQENQVQDMIVFANQSKSGEIMGLFPLSETVGISACLCGQNVRYDGGHCLMADAPALANRVMICPEMMGGLPTPRSAAEIVGGDGTDVWQGRAKVMTQDGSDVTEAFKQGALLALKSLQDAQIQTVWLKSKSPSCGQGQIYDGSFQGVLKTGDGVTTVLLRQHGIAVVSV